jgi:hypothetical protein
MKIAIFSGLDLHFEMFGYIIYFCKINNHQLTIYHSKNDFFNYIVFYKNFFNDYSINYKDFCQFDNESHLYDAIFLTTDDDYNYKRTDMDIVNKTICIEHYFIIRSGIFNKRIATRPFPDIYYRTWALPVYPMINSYYKNNIINSNNEINIVISGYTENTYNISIINRLINNNNKIMIIHAISGDVCQEQFINIDSKFILKLYKNIYTQELYNILYNSDYVLIDVSSKKDHCCFQMSGIIPMAFSTLTPLIISKETNFYYQFKNMIEYEKNSKDNITLENINIDSLEKERDEMIYKNNMLFTNIIIN